MARRLKPGHVYLAPGLDFHMTPGSQGGLITAQLDQGPPVNFCRPAVDPLFNSCAKAVGQWRAGRRSDRHGP
jgi:two-component system chemotaxis response regulator CheB